TEVGGRTIGARTSRNPRERAGGARRSTARAVRSIFHGHREARARGGEEGRRAPNRGSSERTNPQYGAALQVSNDSSHVQYVSNALDAYLPSNRRRDVQAPRDARQRPLRRRRASEGEVGGGQRATGSGDGELR